MSHPIVMGRKTFDSIGKPLPGRTNIVLSRSERPAIEGVHVFAELAEAETWARNSDAQEFFVIGGESLYHDSMPHADRIFLTRVDAEPEGDVFFPEIDESIWRCIRRESHSADGRHAFGFDIQTWERRR